MCICVEVCAHEGNCLWMPEEDNRSPGSRVSWHGHCLLQKQCMLLTTEPFFQSLGCSLKQNHEGLILKITHNAKIYIIGIFLFHLSFCVWKLGLYPYNYSKRALLFSLYFTEGSQIFPFSSGRFTNPLFLLGRHGLSDGVRRWKLFCLFLMSYQLYALYLPRNILLCRSLGHFGRVWWD